MSVIDHVVIAGPDLAGLERWFAELTGVEPSPGGAHTGAGTRNALAALGPRTYVELIGPDPEQPEPPRPRPFAVDRVAGPTLTTFAVWPDDIDRALVRLRDEVGIDLGGVRVMSRRRPDGVELSWRLTASVLPAHGGVFPFLIDWGTTAHPAATAATGCGLDTLVLRHPEPDRVAAALAVVGLDDDPTVTVEEGADPGLELRLETPRGPVTVVAGPDQR